MKQRPRLDELALLAREITRQELAVKGKRRLVALVFRMDMRRLLALEPPRFALVLRLYRHGALMVLFFLPSERVLDEVAGAALVVDADDVESDGLCARHDFVQTGALFLAA